METKQKLGFGGAIVLPILAGAIVGLTPQPVSAMASCFYAGLQYSTGACIESVCTEPDAQQCDSNGEWTICGPCGGLPPL